MRRKVKLSSFILLIIIAPILLISCNKTDRFANINTPVINENKQSEQHYTHPEFSKGILRVNVPKSGHEIDEESEQYKESEILDNLDLAEELAVELNEPQSPIRFGFMDAHADTITAAKRNGAGMYDNNLHLDFKRLSEFEYPVVQVFAIYLSTRHLSDAFNFTNDAIDFFINELEAHNDLIRLALSLEDIEANAKTGISSAILAIEGGESLEGSIDNLYHFYDRGVRLITLTWNRENELGYGVGTDSINGLKPFGIEVVTKMNELGMIVDVSHLNEAGFWDVDEISTRPYMASHSNSFTITPNRRNLNDDQILAIAKNGGFIGMNLYPFFLETGGNADLNSLIRHINHFSHLGVLDFIGLGSDFDGVDRLPAEITDVSSLKILENRLTDDFGQHISESIMSLNLYEFVKRFYN
jgi:membrane dipeptidase